jgi:hypothetical protein
MISHFREDPSAVIALQCVARIFDHSEDAMVAFEKKDFACYIWELFRSSKEVGVRYWAIQVLNRWMRLAPGNYRIYSVYLRELDSIEARALDARTMDAISEGVYKFVKRGSKEAEFAVEHGGLGFSATVICCGAAQARHFGIMIAVKLLETEIQDEMLESFVSSLEHGGKKEWPFLRVYSPRESRDAVALLRALHLGFSGFPRYLLDEQSSLMAKIATVLSDTSTASKIELFELVAFWLEQKDDSFIIRFWEVYSVRAFLDDIEELGPGSVRDAILRGVAAVLTHGGRGRDILMGEGLADTLTRLCDDEFCGEQAQVLFETVVGPQL